MFKIMEIKERSFIKIPNRCRACLYWQTRGEFGKEKLKADMEKQKLEWFRTVTKEFGSCIKIALSDSVPVGFMQYAPAKYFPRVKEYTSGPPSEDAIFIACLYVPDKNQRGKGFGKAMLKNLIEDLRERGFGTVETFARTSSENNPSGPLKLYLKFNFEVKSEKDDFPLVRLKL